MKCSICGVKNDTVLPFDLTVSLWFGKKDMRLGLCRDCGVKTAYRLNKAFNVCCADCEDAKRLAEGKPYLSDEK